MNLNENHIIIGLGGTGGKIIRAFRKRIFTEYNADERRKLPIGYVYVDSSEEMMNPNDPTWKILGANTQLGKSNQVFIRGASLKSLLDNVDNFPGIKKWIGDRKIWENIIGSVADDGAAAQKRRLGRFLFSNALREYLSAVAKQYDYTKSINNKPDVTFHIVAGLAGGTGSGSIIDAIAQLRQKYQPNISSGINFKIFPYLLVPENIPPAGWDAGYYHENGYAALKELNALQTGAYKFADISGEYEKIEPGNNSNFFTGSYLFSNANGNITIDTGNDLPNIIGDFLYQKILRQTGGNQSNNFGRCENYENMGDRYEDENGIKSRTRDFLTFGIKRIEIPEEEIKEYFTYNFSRQALLQFKYNNWIDTVGFSEEQKNVSNHAYVNDKNTLRKWMLSDDHITLSLPVLAEEKKQNWKTIEEDWAAIVPQLKSVAWQKNETTALNDLSIYCEERFEKNFRKIGVEQFYRNKLNDKQSLASEISKNIERDLFDDWKNGLKSISEIDDIITILKGILKRRLDNFETDLNNFQEEIDKQIINKKKNDTIWSDISLLKKLLGKKENIFEAQGVILQTLYTAKTNKIAYEFAKDLLAEVLTQIITLSNEIDRFKQTLNNAIEKSNEVILSHLKDNEITSDDIYKDPIIRYYNAKKVKEFSEKMIRDSDIQENQATDIRNKLITKVGDEPTFTKMNKKITAEYFEDVLLNTCKTHSIAAHKKIIENENGQKIIGVNIVEKLYDQYGNDYESLREFIRRLVEYSGVLLTFNQNEENMGRSIIPNYEIGINVKKTYLSISIPESKNVNDSFVEELRNAFVSSIKDANLEFDSNGQPNEIVIVNLISGFPLRFINEVHNLRDKYKLKLKGSDEETIRLVLHIEGDGDQYPRIIPMTAYENKAEEEKRQIFIEKLSYYMLAISLGLIKMMDLGDGTGKKEYGLEQTDKYGGELNTLFFGKKVIESHRKIETWDNEKIKNEVDSKLRGDFLHQEKRVEAYKAVTNLLNDEIQNECKGNKNDPVYIDFTKAREEAFKILDIEE